MFFMSQLLKPFSVPRLKQVLELKEIDPLKELFSHGLELPFTQNWVDQPEADFQTGKVQVLWDPSHLHILATFQDEDIVGLSTNGMMRSLCVSDIFQVFIDDENELDYREIHVTPDNQCKLLRWSEDRFRKFNEGEISLDEILMDPDGSSRNQTWVEKENNQWTAYLALASTFFSSERKEFGKGSHYRIGFCRFDTSPSSPQSVLSSTCSFKDGPLFHQRQYWHDLELL